MMFNVTIHGTACMKENHIVKATIVHIDEFRRPHGHVTSQMNWEYKDLKKKATPV